MYERILVTLDGTPLAEQALVHAVSIARRTGAHVHLATVRRLMPVTLLGTPRPAGFEDVESNYLEGIAERVREAGVSSVFPEVFTGGDVVEAIEGHRRKVDAGVTVIATHGRGPVRREWMGSVADRFVRTSAAPVLLVRADGEKPAELDLAADTRIGRVLVPLDGSAASEEALEPALELCRLYEAGCTLVHVVESLADVESTWVGNPFEATEEQLEAARAVAEAELDPVCERIRSEGFAVERMARVAAHVVEGILECAADSGADLIAMATHGRGGLPRLVLGSVADKVIRAADLPVLVVPPGGR
ncbi:MAG: universal stress protein [Gemmatimonadota bacterium]|nr:universal stress protein [Gemmatimonadota bacterium]MDH3421452.1 universal stress protein [Gemmatimonadota bacterium]